MGHTWGEQLRHAITCYFGKNKRARYIDDVGNTVTTVATINVERLRLTEKRTLACSDTLDPCMIIFCVDGITAILEPSATRSTTALLARFLDNTTLGACGTGFYCDGRRGDT